ncbi:MAG: class IV adenylate cyclase [Candidatus Binatia bacterium]|nr:class IV adenylate cyclase [Candidatus Binatia bacterium]
MLEAEIKLQIDEPTAEALHTRLATLGASAQPSLDQRDLYFAHPGRDFAQTDEALRLRFDAGGLKVTYKGPKLDPPRKTREEIEFPLGTELDTARTFLERLGFTTVAGVVKDRTEYVLDGPPRAVISLDRIDGLGVFCEIEVATASVEQGRTSLEELARRLEVGEHPPIAESYLELLLAKEG